MSKGNLSKFFEELNANSDLNEQFNSFVKSLSNLSDDEKEKKLTEFITKQGYTVGKSDSKEFSEDEMANVAGGGLLNQLGQDYVASKCGSAAAQVFDIIV